jgi:hypothetical protein
MEPRRRWGTAFVVVAALAFGGGGAFYLFTQWEKESGQGHDGALVTDASADARVARGKPKGGKKGARSGGRKPRGGAGPAGPRPTTGGGGENGGGGHAAAPADNGVVDDVEDDDDKPTPRPPPPFRGRGPAGPTYEAAMASNNQEVTIGKQAGPDLTDAQIAGPMRSGSFVDECGAPDGMKVVVKVAIKMGRAAGVSVTTSPSDPDVAGCIDRYVRTFSWPSSPKMDSFTTTY